MTVEEASKVLGMTPQFIRIGLQQERLPFGVAVKTSENRWTYHIVDSKVYEFAGLEKHTTQKPPRPSIGEFNCI